jgi:membrane protease YdiL (CAAX protease family)
MVSLGLLIAGIVLIVKGRIQSLYVPDPSASAAFLEVFALYLVLFFVVFGLVRRAFGWTNLNWEWLTWLIIPIVMIWAVRQGVTIDKCRMALGWHRGRGWGREIVAGLAGYLAGLVFLALGLVITALLIKLTNASPRNWLAPMLSGNAWHVLALYGLVSVFAPVIEETMFRGALFHYLRGRWRWAISATIVTSIFALMHPQGWVAFPALGAIAMVLAALREWRGSIIAPMAAHAFNNFIVLTLALVLLR